MSIRQTLLAGAALALVSHAAAARELKSVGLTVGSLGNPYFLALVEGAKKEAHAINPAATVTAVSSDYDLGKQFTQMDNFIASGVDLILVAAADPRAIGSAIKRAQAAGITVVAVDVEADNASATVETDNTKAGEISCDYLAGAVGGKGNVVIQTGPQTSSVIARVKGCKAALAKHPAITILSDNQDGKVTREGGMNVMMGHLTRYPSIQGVFTVTDPQAIGANLAAKQLNRSDAIITSVDGAPDVVNALKSDTLIRASAAQNPAEQGRQGVRIGYGMINGTKPETPITMLPPVLVTRDNVNEYKGW